MFKKYLRKKQYAKIKTHIENKISLIQELIDLIPDDKADGYEDMSDVIPDCKACKLNTDTYELLQIGTGFWSGDYAIVQKDGKITKVALRRVYDVKEK